MWRAKHRQQNQASGAGEADDCKEGGCVKNEKGKAKKAAEADVGGEREEVWKLKTRWAWTGWGWQ